MAEKQAGGLNLRIGLTLSQLQSDFLAAEQTIRQGMANLNRQQNLVKIRMDADITGLDAVADKTKILEFSFQTCNGKAFALHSRFKFFRADVVRAFARGIIFICGGRQR